MLASVLLAAGLLGCSGSVGHSGMEQPVPLGTLHRLPAGVFYVLAGRPNIYSANVWAITSSGREVQLTHNRVGFGISWMSASSAGIIMADASNGVDELARLTSRGAQWMPVGRTGQPQIHGQAPAIDDSGEITYSVPPSNSGPAHNDNSVWVASSFSSPGRIIYKQAGDLAGEGFGPGGQIAIMDRPYDPPLNDKRAQVLIIAPDGRVRTVDTDFWQLAGVAWRPNATALAVSSVSRNTELIFNGGRDQLLPKGWQAMTWSPDGNKLLVQKGRQLGLWSAAEPRRVMTLGATSRQYTVLNVAWLSRRAPL